MTPSPVVCSVGEVPRQAPAQHHGSPPDPAVSRHLIFESPEPLPPAPPEVSRAKAQGTSHDSALDPLSVVLTGMAQLQGMMSEIATSPKSSVKSEVIKPGIPSLPDLPPVSQEACLEFSDWLHNSRPALADVSDSSEELWEPCRPRDKVETVFGWTCGVCMCFWREKDFNDATGETMTAIAN